MPGGTIKRLVSDKGFGFILASDGAEYFFHNSAIPLLSPARIQQLHNSSVLGSTNYLLSISRFAHYLKIMARDKIGSFMEVSDCEKWLNEWINNYVVGNPGSVSDDVKAQRPLAAAEVRVEEVKGKPGFYNAVAYLRPHFQLEALASSMRLVAEVPKKA